ncbi:MAG: hypothetical protein R3C59_09460 [Planctomycetaceae bacterium]
MSAKGSVVGMAVCLVIVCCGPGRVNGQEKAGATDLPSLVAKGDEQAKAACERTIGTQREFLDRMGTYADFREYAEGMIGLSEKMAQGQDLFQSNASSRSRMHLLFREKIFDDSTLSGRLKEQYEALQMELIRETIRICYAANHSDAEIDATFSLWAVQEGAWSGAYDGLIAKADRISKSDWFREAIKWVSVDISADAIRGVAGSTGLWPKEGGWGDLIGRVLTSALVSKVIDEVTDPVGDIAKSLHADYQAINRQIIDSPGGFAKACRELTEHHIQGRHKLLGIPVKEVK